MLIPILLYFLSKQSLNEVLYYKTVDTHSSCKQFITVKTAPDVVWILSGLLTRSSKSPLEQTATKPSSFNLKVTLLILPARSKHTAIEKPWWWNQQKEAIRLSSCLTPLRHNKGREYKWTSPSWYGVAPGKTTTLIAASLNRRGWVSMDHDGGRKRV